MKKMKRFYLAVAMSLLLCTSAFAHFQMLYTPESALEKGTTIELREVFRQTGRGGSILCHQQRQKKGFA
jgi:uncharacterized GH25 family protein